MLGTFFLWANPLWGAGYQFWSGIGANAFLVCWLASGCAWARHHNCHVKGCPRLGHPDPDHGWPACRKHHSAFA